MLDADLHCSVLAVGQDPRKNLIFFHNCNATQRQQRGAADRAVRDRLGGYRDPSAGGGGQVARHGGGRGDDRAGELLPKLSGSAR